VQRLAPKGRAQPASASGTAVADQVHVHVDLSHSKNDRDSSVTESGFP
jgi:hypothetical protein